MHIVPQHCGKKHNLLFEFFSEKKKKLQCARAKHMMDVSLGLFDKLIESCALSSSRLSAANDGLLSVNRTNAPGVHLTGKSVIRVAKEIVPSQEQYSHNSVMCSICLIWFTCN